MKIFNEVGCLSPQQEMIFIFRYPNFYFLLICFFAQELSQILLVHTHLIPRSLFFFFYNLFIILFFKFWLRWVFVAERGLSLVAVSGGYSSLRCAGFSSQWLLLLWSTGSRVCRLQQLWLTGSRVQARQLWHTGLVAPRHSGSSGPGLEPVSPALAGRFLTTAPPGKPQISFKTYIHQIFIEWLCMPGAVLGTVYPLAWYACAIYQLELEVTTQG